MNKKVIRINENHIRNLVKEALRKLVKEDIDGYDDENEIDPDDWQSEEPSDLEVNDILMTFKRESEQLGLNFRDLGEKEFAVTCKIGDNGKATCDIKQFLEMAAMYVNRGVLKIIGHGISKAGTWYYKYRIIKGQIVSESKKKRKINEAEDYGWIVETDEAQLAYQYFCEEMGIEAANEAIIRAMSDKTLSEIMVYLLRMYDMDGWEEYKEEHSQY